MLTSLDDIKSLLFWKALAAEFIGTLFIVLAGCGSCIQGWPNGSHIKLLIDNSTVHLTHNYSTADIVQIALAFGLSVATVVWIFGHVSGGHVNPAVTCAMLITRRVSLARGLLFVVFQLFGAIAGAAILKGLTPDELEGTLGCTLLGKGVNNIMGVGVELCITYILVLTVFAASDKRRKDLGGSVPLAIGLSVTMCHLFAVNIPVLFFLMNIMYTTVFFLNTCMQWPSSIPVRYIHVLTPRKNSKLILHCCRVLLKNVMQPLF